MIAPLQDRLTANLSKSGGTVDSFKNNVERRGTSCCWFEFGLLLGNFKNEKFEREEEEEEERMLYKSQRWRRNSIIGSVPVAKSSNVSRMKFGTHVSWKIFSSFSSIISSSNSQPQWSNAAWNNFAKWMTCLFEMQIFSRILLFSSLLLVRVMIFRLRRCGIKRAEAASFLSSL